MLSKFFISNDFSEWLILGNLNLKNNSFQMILLLNETFMISSIYQLSVDQ